MSKVRAELFTYDSKTKKRVNKKVIKVIDTIHGRRVGVLQSELTKFGIHPTQAHTVWIEDFNGVFHSQCGWVTYLQQKQNLQLNRLIAVTEELTKKSSAAKKEDAEATHT